MSLLSLFAFVVYAAETIISPIPDGTPIVQPVPPKPEISFGQITQVVVETIVATPSATPTPPPLLQTKKKNYTIAFLGDSMIDTMGPGLPAVKNKLNATYSSTNFNVLNFGVGATNIEYGIERITKGYEYLGQKMPSLSSVNPDIVVIESFGYNPFPDPESINRHWWALSQAVDTIRSALPQTKILIAATIAPNSERFGDGAEGLAFGAEDKLQRTNVIKAHLDSTVKFAKGEHLPLADAYHTSLDANGDGILKYINSGDHIHYSDAGRALFAQKIVDAIRTSHLLE